MDIINTLDETMCELDMQLAGVDDAHMDRVSTFLCLAEKHGVSEHELARIPLTKTNRALTDRDLPY